MTAPTPRETSDHAELARLAEAAVAHLAGPNLNADGFGLQIWGDSLKGDDTHVLDVRGWGYLTGGGSGALGLSEDDGIAAQRAIQAYVVAAWNSVPALLSEIAALRGLLDERGLEIAEDDAAMRDLDAQIEDLNTRLTQAERQRDELRKALELAAKRFETLRDLTDHVPHRIACSTWADEARQANQGADQ